ncbi:uncharacterized protein LOC119534409 [Choloepus didactylus]|uniref:uncharacterized protein LOC119527815 n=1 Tax=Choloepus didactylus TaxID=27675 RepID=UPI0018A03DB4|nr:uncharacterized protein LOC119527815 [Choloepus didactylus]XP_037692669.1 uncharacterized protein LOC119534409 [Choloepus didactylus]
MESVNELANATRKAIQAHGKMLQLNSQAIQSLQLEIQELGQEIDVLWEVIGQACDARWLWSKICVTPTRANTTVNIQKISDWLKNTYLPEFQNLTLQVESSLDRIGGIKLQPVTFDLSTLKEKLGELWSTVTSWLSWPNLTNWVLLAVGLLVGLIIVKSLLERLFQKQQQLRVTAMMAMSSACNPPDDYSPSAQHPSQPLEAGHSRVRFAAMHMEKSRL